MFRFGEIQTITESAINLRQSFIVLRLCSLGKNLQSEVSGLSVVHSITLKRSHLPKHGAGERSGRRPADDIRDFRTMPCRRYPIYQLLSSPDSSPITGACGLRHQIHLKLGTLVCRLELLPANNIMVFDSLGPKRIFV